MSENDSATAIEAASRKPVGDDAPVGSPVTQCPIDASQFNAFVKELEDVEPKFGLLGKRRAQWDLLSDRLRALGYDKKEIDALYKKLKGRKVTLEDTTTFSRRWKDKYGEDVPPQIIYDFLNNPDSGNADS